MPRRAFSLDELDTFMGSMKHVVNPQVQTEWAPDHIAGEKEMSWLLAIDGTILPNARLALAASTVRREMMFFRLKVLCPMALCRLDHTDEPHPNPLTNDPPNLPPFVEGPHLHPWELNRRYFEQPPHSGVVQLHIAVPFAERALQFDAILRWFCDQARIEPLPPNHVIELPDPDRFL